MTKTRNLSDLLDANGKVDNTDILNVDAAKITTGTLAAARINNNSLANVTALPSGVGGTAWQSVVTASTLTAVAGKGYPINTTSNACTITLPSSASVGDTIQFVDYARNWGTNALTINQNSLNFQGYATPNPVYNTKGQSVTLTYVDATKGWIPTVDDDVTLETPQPYDIDFLVVAGGGSGGGWTGGGGGAGGYRTSTQTISNGTVYTVTVGDGGASINNGGATPSYGNNGSTSSISGSGLTTITSAGGGGGGGYNPGGAGDGAGRAGGSGGGGGGASSQTAGSGNTPSTSPSQGNAGSASNGTQFNLGGGGGAGAVGGATTTTTGGNGGAGTASSITGSSVTYAGGGGGHSDKTSAGTGGAGGGGAGGTGAPGVGTNGTVNLGGGGGGARDSGASGAGGKGVVILSMPDESYSGTTTGSPTVATGVSGQTVLTFTGTGSYTA
jgi:hypothetical protein